MREPWRRIFDLVVASLALLVTSPLLLVAAIAIAAESRGGILYRQRRVGRDGREFDVLKLRTMVAGAERMGAGLAVDEGDARITKAGAILRRTSIDELPNLVNVLRGEMSIIGPRPTVPSQVERYTDRQRGRLAVKPGITGWAQVHGRASLPWPERIELDLWYIEHRSPRIDLQILGRTALLVIGGDGLYRGATGGWDPGSGTERTEDQRRAARLYRRRRLTALGVLIGTLLVFVLAARAIVGGEDEVAAGPSWDLAMPQAPVWLEQDAAIGRAVKRLDVLRIAGDRRKEIALTFDDGPSPYTPKVLAALRRYGAHGTFFQVGTMIDEAPEQTRAMTAMPGVELGNHTLGHPRLDLAERDQQEAQIAGGTEALKGAGAQDVRLFRPPYGATNSQTLAITDRFGLLPVNWSIDSRDYAKPGVAAIVDGVVSQARPGSIVLLHDGGGDRTQTVQALPRILSRLKRQGYRFVTVSELLVGNPPPTEGNTRTAGPAYTATDSGR